MALIKRSRFFRFALGLLFVAGFAAAVKAYDTPNCYVGHPPCGGTCYIATLGCQYCHELPGECAIEYNNCQEFVCGPGCTAGCTGGPGGEQPLPE